MDPIQGTGGPRPINPGQQDMNVSRPAGTSQFEEHLAGAGEARSPVPTEQTVHLDAQVQAVRELREQGMGIDEIRRGLVENDLKSVFGPNPPQELVDSVHERVRTDPILGAMFNKIIAAAQSADSDK